MTSPLVIGSQYEQRRSELIRFIQKGKVAVVDTDRDSALCYFCQEPFTTPVRILEDMDFIHNNPRTRIYPIDQKCLNNYQSTDSVNL